MRDTRRVERETHNGLLLLARALLSDGDANGLVKGTLETLLGKGGDLDVALGADHGGLETALRLNG